MFVSYVPLLIDFRDDPLRPLNGSNHHAPESAGHLAWRRDPLSSLDDEQLRFPHSIDPDKNANVVEQNNEKLLSSQ
jgi:hypothetical protein